MSLTIVRRCAAAVLADLGAGHSESVYHEALRQMLESEGVAHRSQLVLPIFFREKIVGYSRADLVVGDLVVEIKANRTPPKEVTPQLRKYTESLSRIERCQFTGMVLNFGTARSGPSELVERPARRVASRFFAEGEKVSRSRGCGSSSSRPSARR